MKKNEITVKNSYFLVLIAMFALISHVSYNLLGDDNSTGWWVMDIATDRVVVISFFLTLFRSSKDKLLSAIFLITSIFFLLLMSYEVAYIFGFITLVSIVQYLISFHLIVSLLILCIYAFSYCRKPKK